MFIRIASDNRLDIPRQHRENSIMGQEGGVIMTSNPTMLHLIKNNTLNLEMASTLWSFISAQTSFVSSAVPRLAGKTTVANAALDLLGGSVSIEKLDGSIEHMLSYKSRQPNGYLTISEISQGPFQDYIWGDEVRELFKVLRSGYSLMTTMHASDVNDVFKQICFDNGVDDQDSQQIGLVVCIKRFGDNDSDYWRRVSEIYQIHEVTKGIPNSTLLFRWDAGEDSFEKVSEPMSTNVKTSQSEIIRRAENLEHYVEQATDKDDEWYAKSTQELVAADLKYQVEHY